MSEGYISFKSGWRAGISPPMGRSMHILFCFRKPFDSLGGVAVSVKGRGRRVETVLRKVYLAERTNGRRATTAKAEG